MKERLVQEAGAAVRKQLATVVRRLLGKKENAGNSKINTEGTKTGRRFGCERASACSVAYRCIQLRGYI